MVFSKESIEFMADLDSQGLMLTYPSQFLRWRLATSNIPCKPNEEHIPKLHDLSPFPMENVCIIWILPKNKSWTLDKKQLDPQKS